MFGFISGIPIRLKHIFLKFKRYFTKPQYENFCRTQLGLIVAGKKEHDIKSINQLFTNKKDQSSLNRFLTEPKWNIKTVFKAGTDLLLSEQTLSSDVEYKIIDDTICKKYSPQTQMACYNHSSTMGTVLSHDYVTSLYVNNKAVVTDGIKLYEDRKSVV